MLRAEAKADTPEGEEIRAILASGKFVSMEMMVKLLIKAMAENPSKMYLLDGFPRTIEQAEFLKSKIGDPELVFYFDVPHDIVIERLVKRGQMSGRSDDNSEIIKKRLQ